MLRWRGEKEHGEDTQVRQSAHHRRELTVLLKISPWKVRRAGAGHVRFVPFSVPLYLNTLGNRL